MNRINLTFYMLFISYQCMAMQSPIENIASYDTSLLPLLSQEEINSYLALSTSTPEQEPLPQSTISHESTQSRVKNKRFSSQYRFICPLKYCGSRYTTPEELRNHNARHHECVKKFPCSIHECPKSYTTLTSLRLHICRTHKEKRFCCLEKQCNEKEFYYKADLDQHNARKHYKNMFKWHD